MKGESNERVHDSQRTGLDGRRIRKQSILLYPPEERERRYDNIRRVLQQIGPSLIAAEERRKKKEMEEREQEETECN